MGIWKRLKRLVKANANAALDQLENPRAELEFLDEDLERERKEIRDKVLAATVAQKRLEKKLEQRRSEVEKWEKKAIKALEVGDESLAKEALKRKQEHERYLDELEESARKQREELEMLKRAERAFQKESQKLLAKRDQLLARLDRAELTKSLSEEDDNSLFAEFEKMSQGIEQEALEVEIQKEVSADLKELEWDEQLQKLEKNHEDQEDLDDALAALKARLGKK